MSATLSYPKQSLATLFAQGSMDTEHVAAMRLLRRRVVLPVAIVMALVALWCAWAPLSGAVILAGRVQAELGRKVVQHQEGGIVRRVLVRPGQAVRHGEALVVIGDVRNDAALDLLRKQQDAEALRAARARAELALAAAVQWPHGMSGEALARERDLFNARRQTLLEQLAALESHARQANARAAALAEQLEASERSVTLAREELSMNVELARSGFVQRTRLMALERGVAELSGRTKSTRGQIAEARMQSSMTANSIAQVRGGYQQRASEELNEATARLRELEDRLRPSQDQVDRQTVRAPVDGVVMGLRVSAPGTVVGPREPLLEIAPAKENLIIEVNIAPADIDHVHKGSAAEVRLSAFSSRTAPLLPANVIGVSPDAVIDAQSKQSWYSAQVEVKINELDKHRELRLQAGMSAEVFVTTPARSLLEYLLEPLGIFARRALREP